MNSVKMLAELSPALTSIPLAYTFAIDPQDLPVSDLEDDSIPVIDFSLLTSHNRDDRLKLLELLRIACQDWGFFRVINHTVPESLMKAVIDACRGFFYLGEEEKREFRGNHVLDPIRCGTGINAAVDDVLFWRDFLKFFAYPEFHSPNKPIGFSELSLEYCKRTREVGIELLQGISESLGLEKCYINKAMNLESGLQIFIANLYPACPQPELAMGLPPHSDHGLLALLIQNEIGGLQFQHNGKWINVNAIPNSFLVIIGDQLEILSNEKCKSFVHRAMVNDKATRMSLAVFLGPSLDTVVGPAPELVDSESNAPAYSGIKYKDYFELQQSNKIIGKSCLDQIRIRSRV